MVTTVAESAVLSPHHPKEPFDQIFLDHCRLVYSVAFRVTGRHECAEDIVQEVFIALHGVWPNIDFKISMKAWLAKAALNRALNVLRSERRRGKLAERDARHLATAHSKSPEDMVAENVDRTSARLALSALKKRDQQLLVLRHSGLSYREVAATLGIRPGSVGKLLERAEAKFKNSYLDVEAKGGAA